MEIYGLQKLTLLDYPGLTACTVFLAGCDLRCPFCHNYELAVRVSEPVMDEEDLTEFLGRRKGLLDGVVFTGGEPCLSPGLPALMGKVKDMGFLVKLDTNGMHPVILEELISDGLVDYAAMDIKNSPGKYAVTAGLPDKAIDMDALRRSIGLIKQLGEKGEFRTTVVAGFHEESDFEAIGQELDGAFQYFLQPFVDRDTVPDRDLRAPDIEELHKYAEIAKKFIKNVEIRGL
ncbi:MAG: anaerobic ribonucleoside-triphosphate reductase activating protein [Lachnospiraceae bacterium]|nr:anaerobic ribonucleoside-triphosphate reductase activating protein [Lachnospiraceae bacterium]